MTYLGMKLDKRLNFCDHIRHVLKKTDVAIRALYPLIKRSSPVTNKNKRLIYKALIRPIMTYAAPAWYGAIANKVSRLITNASRLTRLQNLTYTNSRRSKRWKIIWLTCLKTSTKHQNPLIRKLPLYSEPTELYHTHHSLKSTHIIS